MENKINNSYAQLFLRFALGIALWSAVADRLGCWPQQYAAWGNMENFIAYTGKITAFLPSRWATTNAYLATFAESVLGLLLIVGFKLRWTATLTGLMLMAFAFSMSLTLGIKAPFDYSVWVGSAGAFLLANQASFPFSIDALMAKKSE